MPMQRPTEPPGLKIVAIAREPEAQFSFSLRAILRKQLLRLAADADMTARAFVLLALKDRGLDVKDDDLLDLRKDRRPKLGDRGTAAG
jgi:hypothetical protein